MLGWQAVSMLKSFAYFPVWGCNMLKKADICAVLLMLFLLSGCASFQRGAYHCVMDTYRCRSKLEPRTLAIEGQSLAFLERPGKGDTIVLIHGFGGDKDNWISFVRYLPDEYRVIALDLPGHGDNPRLTDKTYSVEYLTASLAQAVDALGLKAFHLVGNSLGGYIAIVYTARHPERIKTLCLYDNGGLLEASPEPSDFQLALKSGRNPLIPRTRQEYDELMRYVFYHEPFIPWPITSFLADYALTAGPFYGKIWTDVNAQPIDLTPLLPAITAPTLVVWGDKDRILHVSTTEVMKRALPKAEFIIIHDCGHTPMLERPQEAAGDYAAFLKRHR